MDHEIICSKGRIIILTERVFDLTPLFGVVSFSPAVRTEQNMEKIKEIAASMYRGKTFRVSARRISKEFSFPSQQVNEIVGEYLVQRGGKVDLEHFDQEIGIEFLDDYVYIFTERVAGSGGLPVGVQGRVLCFIEDERDIRAAYLMLKRGCEIDYCGKEPNELYRYSSGHEIRPYDGETRYTFAVSGKTLDNFKELLRTKRRIEENYGMKTLFPLAAYHDRIGDLAQ
jgi:thiamine biosynthesis protein ThiI